MRERALVVIAVVAPAIARGDDDRVTRTRGEVSPSGDGVARNVEVRLRFAGPDVAGHRFPRFQLRRVGSDGTVHGAEEVTQHVMQSGEAATIVLRPRRPLVAYTRYEVMHRARRFTVFATDGHLDEQAPLWSAQIDGAEQQWVRDDGGPPVERIRVRVADRAMLDDDGFLVDRWAIWPWRDGRAADAPPFAIVEGFETLWFGPGTPWNRIDVAALAGLDDDGDAARLTIGLAPIDPAGNLGRRVTVTVERAPDAPRE